MRLSAGGRTLSSSSIISCVRQELFPVPIPACTHSSGLLSSSYATVLSVFTHHQWIGGIFTVGSVSYPRGSLILKQAPGLALQSVLVVSRLSYWQAMLLQRVLGYRRQAQLWVVAAIYPRRQDYILAVHSRSIEQAYLKLNHT